MFNAEVEVGYRFRLAVDVRVLGLGVPFGSRVEPAFHNPT
jgi:hypothetical protein